MIGPGDVGGRTGVAILPLSLKRVDVTLIN